MRNIVRHIAVIGCGRWGRNRVRNFAELGALRVACDTDPLRLASAREQLPDIQLTTALAAVLKYHAVTGAVIATPACSHAALAKEALLAGKDVFVEDPLAVKVGEGRELIELMVQADLERYQQ